MQEIGALIRERIASGQTVEMSPRGVSMLPIIKEGRDSVILAPVDRPIERYDVILYRRENGN